MEITSERCSIDGCEIADTTPGLEKRRSVSLGSADGDVANSCMKTITKRSSLSFAPVLATHHLIDDQTKGLMHELWYSQHDFMFFRDQAWLCSQAVLSSISQGMYDYSELGDILGLDKFLLHEEYSDRRETLRQTLLVQQEVQKIMCMYSDGVGDADGGVTDLAETSERNSCWARERASIAALTLEHDLLFEFRSRDNSTEGEYE